MLKCNSRREQFQLNFEGKTQLNWDRARKELKLTKTKNEMNVNMELQQLSLLFFFLSSLYFHFIRLQYLLTQLNNSDDFQQLLCTKPSSNRNSFFGLLFTLLFFFLQFSLLVFYTVFGWIETRSTSSLNENFTIHLHCAWISKAIKTYLRSFGSYHYWYIRIWWCDTYVLVWVIRNRQK